jgi:hypothetical protein
MNNLIIKVNPVCAVSLLFTCTFILYRLKAVDASFIYYQCTSLKLHYMKLPQNFHHPLFYGFC